MTNLEITAEAFQGLLAQACLSALLAMVVVFAAVKILKSTRAAFSGLWRKSRMGLAAVAILSLTMMLWGDKTNLLRQAIHPASRGGAPALAVSEEDILRGYWQEGVTTNETPFCEMPTNAVEYAPWRQRGGRETDFPLNLGDFVFPYGTNIINRFRVLSGGMIETYPALNGPASICAAREYASLVPGVSRFWSADANGGAEKVLRWESVFANRDRTGEYSAEIRLSANGDFTTRSNALETVYRRVNPHDWDGDGLANEIDANPRMWDGDFFGPANVLPEGANSNAYCRVSLVVSGADALVSFVGDGPSNYPDPRFVARHGVTNDVLILVGKTYDIMCDQPFAIVGASDTETEATASDGAARVVRPVEMECTQESGAGFSMLVSPSSIGAEFTWEQDCCRIAGNATDQFAFRFVENPECLCLGCQARGECRYEGYVLPAYGGTCPCHRTGDEPNWEVTSGPVAPGVSAAFTTSAVIYEDAYENAPGEWMPKRSTRTRLNVGATGGPNGGTLTVDTVNISKLDKLSGPVLPAMSVSVPAESSVSYSIVYEAGEHSATTNDIAVVATFVENMSGEVFCSTTSLTSVRVELDAIYEAPENPCVHRHVYGVGEKVECRHIPESAEVVWNIVSPRYGFNSITNGVDCDSILKLSFKAEEKPMLRALCCGTEYFPEFSVVEPEDIVCRNVEWDGQCLPHGRAGGFGMYLYTYVLPMNVSFQGIDMLEEPCNEVIPPKGFYASTNFNGVLSHTLEAGAGWWHHVKPGNYWAQDNAHAIERQPPWSEGQMSWKIPVAWYQRLEGTDSSWGRNLYVNIRRRMSASEMYRQNFTITEDGTISIWKFQHEISRATNDVIRLDGEIVHWGWGLH